MMATTSVRKSTLSCLLAFSDLKLALATGEREPWSFTKGAKFLRFSITRLSRHGDDCRKIIKQITADFNEK
jgi:hypothetical protein